MLAHRTQARLLEAPMAGLMPVTIEEANALLKDWGHYLGPCHRPFRQESYAFEVQGEPIGVAVSASIVSDHVQQYRREEVVELARLCVNPDHRWATRVVLRLWREVAAPRWKCWPVRATVAYSQTRRHEGDTYRFDGWTLMADGVGSSGGGSWSRKRYPTDAAHGKKRLWVWDYGRAGR